MSTTTTLDEAKLAFDSKDYQRALAGADRALRADARSVKAWRLKLAALRKTGDVAMAETISSEAVRLFPNADWPLAEHAHAAAMRGDTFEALERFAKLRDRFGHLASGYIGAIRLARKTSQHAMAESILADGLQRLPSNEQLAALRQTSSDPAPNDPAPADSQASVIAAQSAESTLAEIKTIARRESRRKINRALALTMFDRLHVDFPDYAPGYATHVECLLQMDRVVEAASLAEHARDRFPNHLGVSVAAVKAISGAGRFEDALLLVAALNERFPGNPALHGLHINVLADSGQENAAEIVAEQTLSVWPQEPGLWREYARIATRRGDWPVALDRWQEAQRRRPGDRSIARQVEIARSQLCIDVPAETSPSIYAHFESLGGEPLGCEFGMVQREGGSDSVGLFRWAAISHSNLIKALDSDLEGFGLESQTILTEVTEYYGLRDTRYGLFTHTFVKRADAPHDKMRLQSCRRMRFLADKLREELSAGEKIFVHKSATERSDDELLALHHALKRRGGRSLLCVQLATARHDAGTVRIVGQNLFVGYVAFFMTGEQTNGGGARFDTNSYNAICTQVLDLQASARPL